MPSIKDFLTWDKFVTPTIIRAFYWLLLILVALGTVAQIFGALSLMTVSLVSGLIYVLVALVMGLVGLVMARITTELILVAFQINENLHAMRAHQEQGGQH